MYVFSCSSSCYVDLCIVVPINYILRRLPFRGSLASSLPEPSETEVVKALRTHASRTLEVRMRLPSSSSSSASVWYGTGKTSRKKDVGGYEVRRRDWATLRDRPSCGWTRARWDDLTAYMVRFLLPSLNHLSSYPLDATRSAYHPNTAVSGVSFVSPNRSSRIQK